MEEVIRGKLPAYVTAVDKTAQRKGRRPAGPVLPGIKSPADLKALSRDELQQLCGEIREFLIGVESLDREHLAAGLGVVELSVALESVLDLPEDRIVWDTGHQTCVHKLLTGRRALFGSMRQRGGIAAFLDRRESAYDTFGAGHASTGISAALGMAAARDLTEENYRVVAVVGDGAMTGGLAYEAMNNAGRAKRPMLVVLNDNVTSLGPHMGAIAHHFTGIRTHPHIKRLRDEALHLIQRLPALGESMGELAKRLESAVKNVLVPGGLFEALGFTYIGPVDGHDLGNLLDLLPRVIDREAPVLLHVLTQQGKGLPAQVATLASTKVSQPTYAEVYGQAMLEAADAFPNMVAITTGRPTSTGLIRFAERYPDRLFNVGKAEAHGVCYAAGLACDGMRPVAAFSSSFLQRAFDQVVHDVATQGLPVVFAIDRAGLVGANGPTHHGMLDLSYLRCVPGMTVAAPRDGNELRDLLWTALSRKAAPFALRFPAETVPEGFDVRRPPRVLRVGSWELLADGKAVAFLAVGSMVQRAMRARELLAQRGVSAAVVNCRFVKPLDLPLLRQLRERFPILVTAEENSLIGGFGAGVLESLDEEHLSLGGVVRCGVPDRFVSHGTRDQLLEDVGLTPEQLTRSALSALDGSLA